MIRLVHGDLLNATEDILAHQVNCKGVMGAGVARQIKEKWPDIFTDYVVYCSAHKRNARDLLGNIWVSHTFDQSGMPIEICHLFGQDGYSGGGRNTDYGALEKSLLKLKRYAENRNGSIALPYCIGCGLGGGDWNGVVYPMIERIFGESDVLVTIYRKEE